MTEQESIKEEITTVEKSSPQQVVKTTKQLEPAVKMEHPQKVFEKMKTIFWFYQIIWYIVAVVEILLGFRFFLKALAANPFSGFTFFINSITNPLTLPFQGIFGASINGIYVVEWSTLFAMVVYLLLAYGLVELFQFIKPVTKEEVEQTVDQTT
ncbi:MAG: hypothetical protein E6H10_15995 [Bacteroidetes bacterium]|nr:MAG: hypothetical protein E6H10_15995 [Bacteroidota bacterium]